MCLSRQALYLYETLFGCVPSEWQEQTSSKKGMLWTRWEAGKTCFPVPFLSSRLLEGNQIGPVAKVFSLRKQDPFFQARPFKGPFKGTLTRR